jgi:hypothetical protein
MNSSVDITTIEKYTKEDLVKFVEHLMNTHFEKLVFLLYNVDVNEHKVKQLISSTNTHQATLIAEAIIERIAEKKKTKAMYKQPKENIADDDRWDADE